MDSDEDGNESELSDLEPVHLPASPQTREDERLVEDDRVEQDPVENSKSHGNSEARRDVEINTDYIEQLECGAHVDTQDDMAYSGINVSGPTTHNPGVLKAAAHSFNTSSEIEATMVLGESISFQFRNNNEQLRDLVSNHGARNILQ
ncbi:hypothetical protein L1887_14082 [Cichorium endivia]|nr:hypothetical protein L1887_14082 [Cichorium endivia]